MVTTMAEFVCGAVNVAFAPLVMSAPHAGQVLPVRLQVIAVLGFEPAAGVSVAP